MVYLDNAATTFPLYNRHLSQTHWMNSNSVYARREKDIIASASSEIKKELGVHSGKILFFRCATEAIEWLSNKLNGRIFCMANEHDSVYNVSIHKYDNPIAVAMQYVNQMTGTIYKIKEIRTAFPNMFYLSDFTAAVGKVVLPTDIDSFCDAVWFSGHKFHTEKNIGAMWISDRLAEYLRATNSIENQFGIVHGTVDVAGIDMLTTALIRENRNLNSFEGQYKRLSAHCLDLLNRNGIQCEYIFDVTNRTHSINALHFKDIDADALSNWLFDREIYVGLGHSACADNNDYRVLNSFGVSDEDASRVIRVSFSKDTSMKDLDYFVKNVIEFYNLFKE